MYYQSALWTNVIQFCCARLTFQWNATHNIFTVNQRRPSERKKNKKPRGQPTNSKSTPTRSRNPYRSGRTHAANPIQQFNFLIFVLWQMVLGFPHPLDMCICVSFAVFWILRVNSLFAFTVRICFMVFSQTIRFVLFYTILCDFFSFPSFLLASCVVLLRPVTRLCCFYSSVILYRYGSANLDITIM